MSAETLMTEVPGQTTSSPEVAYVLSSMYGFGHSSRAIAIAQALNPPQPITFVARGAPAHKFLKNNLADYGAPLDFVEPGSERPMTDEEYIDENQHLVDIYARSGAILNDFQHHIPGIRALMTQSGVRAPLVGIYHSVTGPSSGDKAITAFQRNFMQHARGLDYLFIAEPAVEHEEPYTLSSGTQVIHTDPIVRQPTLTSEEVKAQIGLKPGEEFIYVQGGGQINGEELEATAHSLHSLSLKGIRIVVAFNGKTPSVATSPDDILYIEQRSDGHNLIAASVGVISKPGMGTIAEAIASRKPLLLVDFPGAEAQSKFEIIERIVGSDVPFRFAAARQPRSQLLEWLEAAPEISSRLSAVPCEGASQVADALGKISGVKSTIIRA